MFAAHLECLLLVRNCRSRYQSGFATRSRMSLAVTNVIVFTAPYCGSGRGRPAEYVGLAVILTSRDKDGLSPHCNAILRRWRLPDSWRPLHFSRRTRVGGRRHLWQPRPDMATMAHVGRVRFTPSLETRQKHPCAKCADTGRH